MRPQTLKFKIGFYLTITLTAAVLLFFLYILPREKIFPFVINRIEQSSSRFFLCTPPAASRPP